MIIRLRSVGKDLRSRKDAAAILEKLEAFEEITLDFFGVQTIGPDFAAGVFQGWKRLHPGTRLVPTNMNPGVDAAVRRASRLQPK